jgi:hypothetical protein
MEGKRNGCMKDGRIAYTGNERGGGTTEGKAKREKL